MHCRLYENQKNYFENKKQNKNIDSNSKRSVFLSTENCQQVKVEHRLKMSWAQLN